MIDVNDLTPDHGNIYLWWGDITKLKVDDIVNAVNSKLLRCFVPNHNCIDNVIHLWTGVQLWLVCYQLMLEQGHDEPTGQTKITSAFNLPAKYILHTVDPIIIGQVSQKAKDLLVSCYQSCLDLVIKNRWSLFPKTCCYHSTWSFPKNQYS